MKKCLFILLFLACVLLLSETANAQTIEEYNINIDLIDTTALVSQSIKADFSDIIDLKLPEDAKITDISAENYTFQKGILTVKIDRELDLKYLTKEAIEKTSKYHFLTNIHFPFDTKTFKLKVVLPESAALDTPTSAYPPPQITSDGINIILDWEKEDLKKGESFPVFVIFKKPSSKWILWIIGAVLVIAIIFFLVKQSIKLKIPEKPAKKTKKKVEAKELHLLESESLVMGALNKLGGEAWQKQLQIQTGFSKAKLSRTIRNLEARRLIKKIPLGNTNKIKTI